MGRNKIDIKPLEDGRNRTVTFTKRKAGLFKKAHELAILCSVDISVIIIGRNNKIYEYSSNDIDEILNMYHTEGMNLFESKTPIDYGDYEFKSRLPQNKHKHSSSLNSINQSRSLINKNHHRSRSDMVHNSYRINDDSTHLDDTVEDSLDISNEDEEDDSNLEEADDDDDDNNAVTEGTMKNRNVKNKIIRGNKINKVRRKRTQDNLNNTQFDMNKRHKVESPSPINFSPLQPQTPENTNQYYNQTSTVTPYNSSAYKRSKNSKGPPLSLQIPLMDDSKKVLSNSSTITVAESSNKSNQSINILSSNKDSSLDKIDEVKLNLDTQNVEKNNESTSTTLPSPIGNLMNSSLNLSNKSQLNAVANFRSGNNNDNNNHLSFKKATFTPNNANFMNINFSNPVETPLSGTFTFNAISPQITTPSIPFPSMNSDLNQQMSSLNDGRNQLDFRGRIQTMIQPSSNARNSATTKFFPPIPTSNNLQRLSSFNNNINHNNNSKRHKTKIRGLTINTNTEDTNNNNPSSTTEFPKIQVPSGGITDLSSLPSRFAETQSPSSLFPPDWAISTGLTPITQLRPVFPTNNLSSKNINDTIENKKK